MHSSNQAGRGASARVSITLCCYNSERFLDHTMLSITAQTYKDWELVIVNDGSTDDTASIVQKYIHAGWPILYYYQQNAGLGASRNKALELARGEFVALIDHDDLWEPEKLALQVPLFSNPKVGLVYSGATVIGSSGEILREYLPSSHMFRGQVLAPLFLGDFLACSTAVMRRSALDLVGPFKTHLKITEEYELFLRLAERNEFDFVESSLMKWRVHATNASKDFKRARVETAEVLSASLQRRPDIAVDLGPRVVSLRMAGFSCTMEQARMLADPTAMLSTRSNGGIRSALVPLTKYCISLFPRLLIDWMQRSTDWIRRRTVRRKETRDAETDSNGASD